MWKTQEKFALNEISPPLAGQSTAVSIWDSNLDFESLAFGWCEQNNGATGAPTALAGSRGRVCQKTQSLVVAHKRARTTAAKRESAAYT